MARSVSASPHLSGQPGAADILTDSQNTRRTWDTAWMNSVNMLQVRNLGANLPSFTSSHIQLETQLVPPSTTRMEEENEGL